MSTNWVVSQQIQNITWDSPQASTTTCNRFPSPWLINQWLSSWACHATFWKEVGHCQGQGHRAARTWSISNRFPPVFTFASMAPRTLCCTSATVKAKAISPLPATHANVDGLCAWKRHLPPVRRCIACMLTHLILPERSLFPAVNPLGLASRLQRTTIEIPAGRTHKRLQIWIAVSSLMAPVLNQHIYVRTPDLTL